MGVIEKLRQERKGTALVWAVVGVALVTGAGLAVNFLSDDFGNPWAWLLVVMLVLVSGWLAYHQTRRAEPQIVSTDALVEEAVLRGAASNWLIRALDPGWILDRIREALERPALIQPRKARKVLEETEHVYAEWLARREQVKDEYLRARLKPLDEQTDAERTLLSPEVQVGQAVLAPLLAALPEDREYRQQLERLSDADRREALVRAYDRHRMKKRVKSPGLATSQAPPEDNPRQDDPWACLFLWLLHDFADKDTLLPLLEARMKSATITPDAIEETLRLARSTLPDDDYEAWYSHVQAEVQDAQ